MTIAASRASQGSIVCFDDRRAENIAMKTPKNLKPVGHDRQIRILRHMAHALGATVVSPVPWPFGKNTDGLYGEMRTIDGGYEAGHGLIELAGDSPLVLAHELGHHARYLVGARLGADVSNLAAINHFHRFEESQHGPLSKLLHRQARSYDFTAHHRSSIEELHAECVALRLLGFDSDQFLSPTMRRLTERAWKWFLKPTLEAAIAANPPRRAKSKHRPLCHGLCHNYPRHPC